MKYKFKSLFFAIGLVFSLVSKISAQNWVKVEGIDSVEIFSIAQHGSELFVVSATDIYRSLENGAYWSKLANKPGTFSKYFTIYAYHNSLFIGTFDDGIYRSTNSGESWIEFNTGLSNEARGIIEFTGRGDSLFVATDASGVQFIDLENPVTWEPFNTGIFQSGSNAIYSTEDYLLANVGMYLFSRNKHESSWQNIYVDTNQAQRQYYEFIEHGNYIFAGSDNGIYRGSRDTKNWEQKDIQSFPTRDINAFATFNERLFASLVLGDQLWIFSSDNFGDSWEIRAHEFSWLYDMIVYNNKLWTARLDGLWYTDLSDPTGIEDIEKCITNDFILYQNYPNPFNPITILKYHIPFDVKRETKNVKLAVYDILGIEVATVVNTKQSPGNYQVEFDARELSNGIYFYTLTTGSFKQSKKMVLLK